MPIISTNLKDYADSYDAGDPVSVGAGLINPNIYATPQYSKSKIQKILLGSICEWSYGGADHDRSPTVLVFSDGLIPQYAMVMGINLNYVPPPIRKAIMKYVVESNAVRIKNNQPLYVTYKMLSSKFREVPAIVRNYKQVLIGNPEVVPLTEWVTVSNEVNKWNNHYRLFSKKK